MSLKSSNKVSEADPDRGFMARTMALCSLPRTNPGQLQYERRNGPFTLGMIAGLNFGTNPRLILAGCPSIRPRPDRRGARAKWYRSRPVPLRVHEEARYL